MQIYDYGFYKITDENPSSNAKSINSSESEFSQILADTLQSQEMQPKLIGILFYDNANGLVSSQDYWDLSSVMTAIKHEAGLNKSGLSIYDFDPNFSKYGIVNQDKILMNGSKAEKAELLNAYKQVIHEGSVVPGAGRHMLVKAEAYINKVLEDL